MKKNIGEGGLDSLCQRAVMSLSLSTDDERRGQRWRSHGHRGEYGRHRAREQGIAEGGGIGGSFPRVIVQGAGEQVADGGRDQVRLEQLRIAAIGIVVIESV